MSSVTPSIRGRLGRVLLALALVWGVVVGGALWVVLRIEIDEVLDHGLQAAALALAGVVGADSAALAQAADSPFAWQLLDARGAVAKRSLQAPAWAPMVEPHAGFSDAPADWRVYAIALDGGRWLLVGQSRGERQETAAEVAVVTIAAALLVGLAAMVWVRWRVRSELQPLADLRDMLAAYDPLQAGRALPPPRRAELQPVHEAIEQLGHRLALRVQAERAFSAHAAHALRTPLAGIDAQLAVALREAPEPLRARLAQLRGASTRLAAVVAALLTLFRSGSELQRTRVDVAALLARLPLEGLEVVVQGGALEQVDADLLAAALINLLENAQRHGARRVELQVRPGGLRLHDDGAGVTPQVRERLAAALERQATAGTAVPPAEPDGLGLGLVLANRVARAHGGCLRLPAVARGFAVDLELASPAS